MPEIKFLTPNKIGGRKSNSIQKWSNDKCWCECIITKEYHICIKDYIWNTDTCNCENIKCLASIIDDSTKQKHSQ